MVSKLFIWEAEEKVRIKRKGGLFSFKAHFFITGILRLGLFS